MATGYFIRKGDKTSCGGEVLEADTRVMMFGFAHARAGDRVSCGKNDETYEIVGGISVINSHGRLVAGSLDSRISCPCKAGLFPHLPASAMSPDRTLLRQPRGRRLHRRPYQLPPTTRSRRDNPVSVQRGRPRRRSANDRGRSVKTSGAATSCGSKTSWRRAAS